MSKLLPDFNLYYDLKSTDDLEVRISQYENITNVMELMLCEIHLRDKIITRLENEQLKIRQATIPDPSDERSIDLDWLIKTINKYTDG